MSKCVSFLAVPILFAVTACRKEHSVDATPQKSSPTPTATPLVAVSSPAPPPAASPSGTPVFDASKLITRDEIQQVQGAPISDVKISESAGGGMRTSQAFYTASEFSKSVSLTVTMEDSSSPQHRDPREFWEMTFHEFEKPSDKGEPEKKEPEAGRGKEEEEKHPPKKIDGIGDQAFWSATRVGGVLYVLKGKAFIRVSVGGADSDEVRLNKTRALAEKALSRL